MVLKFIFNSDKIHMKIHHLNCLRVYISVVFSKVLKSHYFLCFCVLRHLCLAWPQDRHGHQNPWAAELLHVSVLAARSRGALSSQSFRGLYPPLSNSVLVSIASERYHVTPNCLLFLVG